MLYKYESEILDLEPFAPPERYVIPETQVRSSNYYPINHVQSPPLMANSNTFASNVYNRPNYEGYNIAPVVPNDSRLQRSNMPVQQLITNSQIHGQIHPMSESMGYSSQFRPIISPTAQQSGVYAQKQSYVPPGGIFIFIKPLPQ